VGAINIAGIEVFAFHGVYENEKRDGQKFIIDLSAQLDFMAVAASDELSSTVNYVELTDYVVKLASQSRFDLLESLAVYIATEVLNRFPVINLVQLSIRKPEIQLGHQVKNFYISHQQAR
jgi:dihydroneopterin aldolase